MLEGTYKEGAFYWSSVRNTDKAKIGCHGPGYAGTPDQQSWANGCKATKSHLDARYQRRNSEPDYKAGWNYVSGQLDRQGWEHWYSGLSEGNYKQGAFYWSSVRSTADAKLGCRGTEAEWIDGCKAAKAKLDYTDHMRSTNADYKAGWNSV